MRLSKFLALATATIGLILILPAPSDAQQGSTTRNAAPPLVQKPKPVVRDNRPANTNTRDHRKSANSAENAPGGVTVTASERRKRGGSPCIKSVLGGPCIGGTVAKVAKEVAKVEPISVGATGVYQAGKQTFGNSGKKSGARDHRKKN